MPAQAPPPDGTVTRSEAAQILGVSSKRVTNMRWQGQLEPVTTPHRKIGLFDRAQGQVAPSTQRRTTLGSPVSIRVGLGPADILDHVERKLAELDVPVLRGAAQDLERLVGVAPVLGHH